MKTLVIIRADKNVNFEKVYRVMRQCQQVGLRHLQLRADRG
ncbi:MAG: ExbD/TolR family protein [Pirellulaceae bacterium]